MRKKLIVGVLMLTLVAVGFGSYYIFWNKVILSSILNSFPEKPWLNEWIQKHTVLVVFDERTKTALGGHDPEIFRGTLLKVLPEIEWASPLAIALDVGFEKETQHDAKLQKLLNVVGHRVVWIRFDTPSRFTRRSAMYGRGSLPLGHAKVALSTVEDRKLHLIELCKVTKEGEILPPLALLVFELSFGLNTTNVTNCSSWEHGRNSILFYKAGSFGLPHDVRVSTLYRDIPKIRDKADKEWIPIRFLGPEGFFTRISLVDLVGRGTTQEDRIKLHDELGNKIVFLGVTVPEVKDRYTTEVGEMDGIEIHANILATFMRVLIEKQ